MDTEKHFPKNSYFFLINVIFQNYSIKFLKHSVIFFETSYDIYNNTKLNNLGFQKLWIPVNMPYSKVVTATMHVCTSKFFAVLLTIRFVDDFRVLVALHVYCWFMECSERMLYAYLVDGNEWAAAASVCWQEKEELYSPWPQWAIQVLSYAL